MACCSRSKEKQLAKTAKRVIQRQPSTDSKRYSRRGSSSSCPVRFMKLCAGCFCGRCEKTSALDDKPQLAYTGLMERSFTLTTYFQQNYHRDRARLGFAARRVRTLMTDALTRFNRLHAVDWVFLSFQILISIAVNILAGIAVGSDDTESSSNTTIALVILIGNVVAGTIVGLRRSMRFREHAYKERSVLYSLDAIVEDFLAWSDKYGRLVEQNRDPLAEFMQEIEQVGAAADKRRSTLGQNVRKSREDVNRELRYSKSSRAGKALRAVLQPPLAIEPLQLDLTADEQYFNVLAMHFAELYAVSDVDSAVVYAVAARLLVEDTSDQEPEEETIEKLSEVLSAALELLWAHIAEWKSAQDLPLTEVEKDLASLENVEHKLAEFGVLHVTEGLKWAACAVASNQKRVRDSADAIFQELRHLKGEQQRITERYEALQSSPASSPLSATSLPSPAGRPRAGKQDLHRLATKNARMMAATRGRGRGRGRGRTGVGAEAKPIGPEAKPIGPGPGHGAGVGAGGISRTMLPRSHLSLSRLSGPSSAKPAAVSSPPHSGTADPDPALASPAADPASASPAAAAADPASASPAATAAPAPAPAPAAAAAASTPPPAATADPALASPAAAPAPAPVPAPAAAAAASTPPPAATADPASASPASITSGPSPSGSDSGEATSTEPAPTSAAPPSPISASPPEPAAATGPARVSIALALRPATLDPLSEPELSSGSVPPSQPLSDLPETPLESPSPTSDPDRPSASDPDGTG